jgi:hypothetical protein
MSSNILTVLIYHVQIFFPCFVDLVKPLNSNPNLPDFLGEIQEIHFLQLKNPFAEVLELLGHESQVEEVSYAQKHQNTFHQILRQSVDLV